MNDQEIQDEVTRLAEDHTDVELLGLIAGDEIGRDEDDPEDAAYIAHLFEFYGLSRDADLVEAINTICLAVELTGKKPLDDSWRVEGIEVTTGTGGPGTWFVVRYGGDVTSFASWSGPEVECYAGNYPELWRALLDLAGEE